MTDDLIGRAEAQTAIQFAAKRYTVAHEAHGEGQVVWSDNLINVTDAMNVLRDLPSAEPDTTTHDSIPVETGKNDGDRTSGDCISRQQAIDFVGSMNMCDEISNEAYEKLTSYLDELPSTQPETNCSDIPNNSDIISRQQAIDALRAMQTYKLFAGDDMLLIDQAEAQTELMMLPTVQPDIIRCKDCKYCEHWYADKGRCFLWHEGGIDVFEEGFCNYAERRTDG